MPLAVHEYKLINILGICIINLLNVRHCLALKLKCDRRVLPLSGILSDTFCQQIHTFHEACIDWQVGEREAFLLWLNGSLGLFHSLTSKANIYLITAQSTCQGKERKVCRGQVPFPSSEHSNPREKKVWDLIN